MQGCFSTNYLYTHHKACSENHKKIPSPHIPNEKPHILSKSPISSTYLPNQNSYSQIHQAKKHIISKNSPKKPSHNSLSPYKEKSLSSKNTEITEGSDYIQSQPKTPSSPYCLLETKESLLKAKLDSLTQADNEINQLSEKIIFKETIVNNKRNIIQTKLKDIKNTNLNVLKKNVQRLCEEIVWNIVNKSIACNLTKVESLLESRFNALELAVNKVKDFEKYSLGVKETLEKQHVLNMQKKMDLAEIIKNNLIKTQQLQKMMTNVEDIENYVYIQEKSLKKREEVVEEKIKQTDELENQLKDREVMIVKREKEFMKANHCEEHKNNKAFIVKENAVKAKELELTQRSLILEQKKGQNEEYKSKIKWKACNLENIAKKSYKIIQEKESRLQEYELYKKTEEKILGTWKENIEKRERKVQKMKENAERLDKICEDIERRVKEKEEKLECMKQNLGMEKILEKKKENEAKLKEVDYSEMKFTDFANGFQVRQMERKKNYEKLSMEKKILTEKIASILNLQ
ncbi:hypothetical protein SteCoe_14228 [Stentor coeruleus]|uniref:Uncharacterized protein n=1 Tax=Stentor coeruleus TaxID=5963 RepID=A0A1R2C6H6_9CILI|nr:hypothetical protein SteCoe_14228 [Stentor coeruleus]